MNQSTCSIDGCEKARTARGWCPMHYQRWRKSGDPGTAEQVNASAYRGRACSVPGCDRTTKAKALCALHYRRFESTGSTGPVGTLRTPNVGDCSVEGCAEPMRKLTYCAGHYTMLHRYGEIREHHYKWAERTRCLECGAETGAFNSRSYCSANCYTRGKRAGGARPKSIQCARCATTVSLTESSDSGRVKRKDTSLCLPCRRENKFGLNVRQIALRDGTDCRICGGAVDMALKRPDSLFGPSVDHVIPRAHGGSDAPENLQLAHYWCNAVKSDRIGFTIK